MSVARQQHALDRSGSRMLEWVARTGAQARVYGQDPEVAAAAARRMVESVTRHSGMGLGVRTAIGWFAGDVARAMAEGQGAALGFELRGLLEKWEHLGVPVGVLRLLFRMLCVELAGFRPEPAAPKNPGAAGGRQGEV